MSSVRLLLFQLIFLLFLNLGFGTTTNLIRKPNLPIPTPPPLLPTNETCFEYELENECSSLLSDVDVNSTIQEILFDSISWNVSDIRMIPSDCRRPLLWFVCGLVFPRCPSETVEQQICRQVEGCRQVNERCESFGLSFDCLFPSLEDKDDEEVGDECSTRIFEEIEEATENGIKVETCLGEEKETIECCPDPFIVDFEGECVVECLQYEYGERFERAIRITLFILLWIGFILFFIAQIPLFAVSFTQRYPNYVLPLSLLSNLMFELFLSFSVFDGGPEEYICGNDENYFSALNSFGRSRVAGIQMSFLMFFLALTYSLWVINSFSTFCIIAKAKWKFFGRFVTHPVSKIIEYSLLAAPFIFSLAMFLFFVIYFFTSEILVYPNPIVFAAFPFEDPLREVDRTFEIVCISLITLFSVTTDLLIFRINYRLLLFQWRGVFVQCYLLVQFAFTIWILYFQEADFTIGEYVYCVTSNPRSDPPPCTRTFQSDSVLVCFILFLIYLFPVTVNLVVYFSNGHVIKWWKELIFNHRVVRDLTDLDHNLPRTVAATATASAAANATASLRRSRKDSFPRAELK